MFPTELEIAEQRRQFQREAENYRLAKLIRAASEQRPLWQRLLNRLNTASAAAPEPQAREQIACRDAVALNRLSS